MKLSLHDISHAFGTNVWKAYRGSDRLHHDDLKIGPNSVDVSLHRRLLYPVPKGQPLPPPDFFPSRAWSFVFEGVDPRIDGDIQWGSYEMPAEGVLLRPRDFVLGAVRERFDCSQPLALDGGSAQPDVMEMRIGGGASPVRAVTRKGWFVQMYEGRSSCGRLGIASHITAGFGDYGFCGAFTLEIYNHAPYPIRIFPGMRIGQVAFEEITEPKHVYQGAYSGDNHNDGPVPPKLGPGRF